MSRHTASRCGATVLVAVLVLAASLQAASISLGDLGSRAHSLQQSIHADNGRIAAYRGHLRDLQSRLSALQATLSVQRTTLLRIRSQLDAARHRLELLRGDLVRDRAILAQQLVDRYESPSPDIVGVVLESHGFTDLLERVGQMKAIARRNTQALQLVRHIKGQVARQASQLADAQARQQRVTAAVLVERDQVATVQLAVLRQERVAAGDRAHKQAQLNRVQHQLAVLQARAAAAQHASFGLAAPAGSGYSGGGFTSHGGPYGFFPAAGTNYSVGQEPAIAARLDALGKALHLHLVGLSGYRSPQHSVEVGGFADDPHTRGEASDTPGVEGVPESTLLRFGLTRPFPGPAEADHIQLA
jgi:peptidoglycan hydrolase CwlO-like protein